MTGRRRLGLAFLIVAAIGAGLIALSSLLLAGSLLASALAVLLGSLLAAWAVVDRMLLRRIEALAAETRLAAQRGERPPAQARHFAALAPVAEAVDELLDRLFQARRRIDEEVAHTTSRVEEQKSRLAAILNDLHEGVVVCNLEHQILLYNRRALSLLRLSGDLGLGRNLLQLVARDPILHALDRLTRPFGAAGEPSEDRHAQVLTALADGCSLLQGRMGLVVADDRITGYVLTLSDATAELATLGTCDALLREATEGLRQPVANLRAAAETLGANPGMAPADRSSLDQVILDQAQSLSARLEGIAAEHRRVAGRLWPMTDILSTDLVGLVAFRAAQAGHTVTVTGLPQWLHGDSHGLVLLFDGLLGRLSRHAGGGNFDISAEPGQDWVYIDLTWAGEPIPVGELSAWEGDTLEGAPGGPSVGDMLRLHQSDLWSEPAGGGRARLRVPLPRAVRPAAPEIPRMPPRPEFFDFDLLHQPLPTGELGRTPLDRLSFVVFDTETTGLSPSGGDALIAIGAVRIVNGRILSGETFNARINPGRSIPSASTRFHGITDAMVRDCPPAEAVLPAFKSFVEGAVLVAHNAAFDLKFLKMSERAAGVRFDNPVLCTLILSRFLQGDEGAHSLDELADRLGVAVVERHSALGDAMATAAIFLRFVAMLKQRGIVTLEDAIRRSNMQVELRGRERAF